MENQANHRIDNRHEVMTLAEVAGYLRCHNSTIYRLLKKRSLPAFLIGSDWRFNRSEIDAWRRRQELEYQRDPQ